MILISLTLNYCWCKTLLCRQHVWLFLIHSRGSNIVEREVIYNHKRKVISRRKKLEVVWLWFIIAKEPAKERGFEYFASKYSNKKYIPQPRYSCMNQSHLFHKKKQDKQITVKQQNIVQDWMRLFLRVHTSGNVNLSQTKVKMRRKFCRNWNSEQNFPTWKSHYLNCFPSGWNTCHA